MLTCGRKKVMSPNSCSRGNDIKDRFQDDRETNGGSYIQIVDLQHLTSGYENKIWHIVKENTMN
jgi:hypothetical protein